MIKILIVDDHQVVRLGLMSLLKLHEDFYVIGEADSQEDAVKKALKFQPNVIIMDVKLSIQGNSHNNGITACQIIKDQLPETKVIMLSSFADDQSIYESIIAGASGYILKGLDAQELIKSVKMVAEGKSLLDPNITAKVFQRMRAMTKQNNIFQELTNQEKEVLKLLSEGKTNKEIAQEMVLHEKTVRNYVSQVLSKLGVTNRIQAASLVMKHKLPE